MIRLHLGRAVSVAGLLALGLGVVPAPAQDPPDKKTAAAVERGVAALKKMQTADGSFSRTSLAS